ncbi:MAG: GWxTD domain-containing protein [Bacteroidales bacterium]|nr:GWxTD domain-containing protein [Bacteroidales bacterium]
MRKRILYLLLTALIAPACMNLSKLSLYDLSGQYSNTRFTSLDAVAVNRGTSGADIYFLCGLSDMRSVEDTNTGRFYIKAGIACQLFDSYESKHILDSSSFVIADSSLRPEDSLMKIRIDYPSAGRYILKLEVTDLNRIDAVSCYLVLDNTGPGSRNHFLARDDEGNILFKNYISAEDHFMPGYSGEAVERLFVRYYPRDFPLALPPFIEEPRQHFDYRPDSSFIIEMKDGRTELLNLPARGFYHFQVDTTERSGFTVFRFPQGFPEVSTPEQLLQPLRYITTQKEFDALRQADDLKLAIDNYWLQIAGNPLRARAMIQKYYGRVVDANNFFSSYLEGWKTDRGLIYIVYGPPGVVYRGEGIEEWIYGEKGNANSMRFRFAKVLNPFTENDYSLIKSPSYKEKWYNIVNSWRR